MIMLDGFHHDTASLQWSSFVGVHALPLSRTRAEQIVAVWHHSYHLFFCWVGCDEVCSVRCFACGWDTGNGGPNDLNVLEMCQSR